MIGKECGVSARKLKETAVADKDSYYFAVIFLRLHV